MEADSRRILIVDDEPDIRDSVADILNEFGYDADTAGDGLEALSKMRDRSYDVALLDFKMPGMDGLAVYREMRQVCPETSAILVSAYTGEGVAEEAINSGIRRVISKPVDMGKVIAQIDEELGRPLALIIDDDSDFCASLRDVLIEQGLRVGLANNEIIAGRLIQSQHPQLVVLDVALGHESDAARVFKTIRQSNPDAGIVLVTGHKPETAPIIRELISDGAAAVCFKPLDVQSLLETLQKLV